MPKRKQRVSEKSTHSKCATLTPIIVDTLTCGMVLHRGNCAPYREYNSGHTVDHGNHMPLKYYVLYVDNSEQQMVSVTCEDTFEVIHITGSEYHQWHTSEQCVSRKENGAYHGKK
jgi:hypothetical protein